MVALAWYLIVSISCLTNVIAKDDVYFDKWLDEHGMSADSVDYEAWKANLEYVEMHNRGGHSFTVTMNKFAHLVSGTIDSICVSVHNTVRYLSISNFKPRGGPHTPTGDD